VDEVIKSPCLLEYNERRSGGNGGKKGRGVDEDDTTGN